jgi:MFS family permease
LNQRTGFAAVLWSSCLAMLAVGANSTAIMAALPSMRTELVLSSAGVEWAVNSYLVVSAAIIVLGGQAADRFGARPASVVGLLAYKDLGRRRDTEARLCLFCGVPSGSWGYLPLGSGCALKESREPRELSADHLQLVLRAGFVELVDQRD